MANPAGEYLVHGAWAPYLETDQSSPYYGQTVYFDQNGNQYTQGEGPAYSTNPVVTSGGYSSSNGNINPNTNAVTASVPVASSYAIVPTTGITTTVGNTVSDWMNELMSGFDSNPLLYAGIGIGGIILLMLMGNSGRR